MTDLRSGLCHGPYCTHPITGSSPSEDFCSDDCQTAWNALHAHPPMPPLSINLPGPSLARWTPEGGAPITPETSTWEPRETGAWVQLDDSDHPDWAWTDVSEYVSDTHGLERRSTVALRMTPVPPTIHAAPGEPEHLLPGDRFRVEQVGGRWQYKIVEVGEAATQSPTQIVPDQRSWWSRLWTWMWLRG